MFFQIKKKCPLWGKKCTQIWIQKATQNAANIFNFGQRLFMLIYRLFCSIVSYTKKIVLFSWWNNIDDKNNLLGTPDTSFRGLNTLIALKVLRSTISWSVSPLEPYPKESWSSWLEAAVKMVMYLGQCDYYKQSRN